MNYDNIINKIFWKENKISSRVNRLRNYPNITNYLLNRYDDTESIKESLQRIKYNIKKRPLCPTCGKSVKYKGDHGFIFTKYCCLSCSASNKETTKKKEITYFNRTGYTHNSKNPESQERIKKTCQNKYGANSVVESYKGKEGRIKSFGANSYFATSTFKEKMNKVWHSEEFKQKIIDGCIKKYGVDWYVQTQEYKNLMNPIWESEEFKQKYKENMVNGMIKKYGVISFPTTEEYKKIKENIMEKKYQTMKRNNSFNISKPEEEFYLYIRNKFPLVERQYKDKERYPWCCDFYIPELDYFVELNGNWTHGKHPFSSTSKEDLYIIEEWKKRSKEHPYYSNAIKTWTIYDVKKRNKAKEENLNFKEVWSLEEGKDFINNLYTIYRNEKRENA